MATLKVPVTPRDHAKGPANAPLTLLEYGDYECPYCGLAHSIVKLIQEHFGRRLRFVFRHFPLSQAHPNAESAAQTAEFAGAHGKFWEMHDGLYENQDRLGLPLYFALAGVLGLSESGLRQALIEETYAPKVRADFLSGVRSGVNGTPCFFINGVRHDGTYAFEDLGAAIELTLRAHAST
jgi:protein-disulfide isomerase